MQSTAVLLRAGKAVSCYTPAHHMHRAQGTYLRDDGYGFTQVTQSEPARINAIDGDVSTSGLDDSEEHDHERRLARARSPCNTYPLASLLTGRLRRIVGRESRHHHFCVSVLSSLMNARQHLSERHRGSVTPIPSRNIPTLYLFPRGDKICYNILALLPTHVAGSIIAHEEVCFESRSSKTLA